MADSILLCSSGDDVKIWDPWGSTVKVFHPRSGDDARSEVSGPVLTVDWSHDNAYLATCAGGSKSGDGKGQVYLTACKADYLSSPVSTVPSCTCVSFSSSSRYLATGGQDGVVSVYDVKARKTKRQYEGHKHGVTSVAFNWNDTHIAAGSERMGIIIHNVVTGQASAPLKYTGIQCVKDVRFSYLKKAILSSVSDDGCMALWDTNTRRLVHSFTEAHRAPATALTFSQVNDILMLSCGLDKKVVCYDADKRSVVKSIQADQPLTAIDLHPDGCTVAVGTTRGVIYTYDLRQGSQPLSKVAAHTTSVRRLRYQRLTAAAKVKADPASVPHSVTKRPGQASSTLTNGKGLYGVTASPLASSAGGGAVTTPIMERNGGEGDVFSPLTQSDGTGPGIGLLLDSTTSSALRTPAIGHTAGSSNFDVFSPGLEALPDHSSVLSQNSYDIMSGTPSLPLHHHVTSGLRGSPHKRSLTGGPFTLAGDPSPVIRSSYSAENVSHLASSTPASSETNRLAAGITMEMTPKLPGAASGNADTRGGTHFREHIQSLREKVAMPRSRSHQSGAARSSPRTSWIAEGAASQKMEPVSTETVNQMAGSLTARMDAGDGAVGGASYGNHPRKEMELASSSNGGLIESSEGSSGYLGEFIRQVVREEVGEMKDELKKHVMNLQVQMFREFQIRQDETEELVRLHSLNEPLLEEVKRLREENLRLRKMN